MTCPHCSAEMEQPSPIMCWCPNCGTMKDAMVDYLPVKTPQLAHKVKLLSLVGAYVGIMKDLISQSSSV